MSTMDNLKIESARGFFVGDVADVLNKEVLEFWETITDCAEGVLEAPGGFWFGIGYTIPEEGMCTDNQGNEYVFDGCFGVIPLELADRESNLCKGNVFMCQGTAEFEYEGNEFTVTLSDGRIIHVNMMED